MDSLPLPIQNSVAQFAEQEFELEESEESPQEIRALTGELKDLDNTLYEQIKSLLDHETSEELSGTDLKAAILNDLIRQGNTTPRVADLRAAGYPLSNPVKINECVGNYHLVKRRYDAKCTIKPLNL